MSKKKYKQFKQGFYNPLNPDKCLNKDKPVYRSKLELRLMMMCDKNSAVLEWSSEKVIIPYYNPMKQRNARYYMDAYIKLQTPTGPKKYLIEIKPYRQTIPPTASKNKKKTTILYENAQWAVNQKKWEAAKQFAKNREMEFMIITEKDLDKMEGKR